MLRLPAFHLAGLLSNSGLNLLLVAGSCLLLILWSGLLLISRSCLLLILGSIVILASLLRLFVVLLLLLVAGALRERRNRDGENEPKGERVESFHGGPPFLENPA